MVIVMLVLSVILNSNMQTRQYFPKFEFDNSKKTVFHQKKSSNGKINTEMLPMPVIAIKSLNDKVVMNSVKMYYYNVSSPYHISIKDLTEKDLGLDKTIDDYFILQSISFSIENGWYISLSPFILEVNYVKCNGSRIHKQAYMFECCQKGNYFYNIRYVKSIKLRKLKNKQYIIDEFNKRFDYCRKIREKQIVGYDLFVNDSYDCVVDTLFSF